MLKKSTAIKIAVILIVLHNLEAAFYVQLKGRCSKAEHHLAMYLVKHATTTSVKTKFTLSVINMKGKANKAYQANEVFGAEDTAAWGWEEFISQTDLTDLGFVKDNTILVKAYVEVL